MSKTLILMQGIPGSGKSTRARELSAEHMAALFSTDDYWLIGPGNTEVGTYTFNPVLLGEAHRWNQQQVAKTMAGFFDSEGDGSDVWRRTIIIDNTNIKRAHVQPYITLAEIFGYEVKVECVECDPQLAFKRGIHGVPLETIQRMAAEMETLV